MKCPKCASNLWESRKSKKNPKTGFMDEIPVYTCFNCGFKDQGSVGGVLPEWVKKQASGPSLLQE